MYYKISTTTKQKKTPDKMFGKTEFSKPERMFY